MQVKSVLSARFISHDLLSYHGHMRSPYMYFWMSYVLRVRCLGEAVYVTRAATHVHYANEQSSPCSVLSDWIGLCREGSPLAGDTPLLPYGVGLTVPATGSGAAFLSHCTPFYLGSRPRPHPHRRHCPGKILGLRRVSFAFTSK